MSERMNDSQAAVLGAAIGIAAQREPVTVSALVDEIGAPREMIVAAVAALRERGLLGGQKSAVIVNWPKLTLAHVMWAAAMPADFEAMPSVIDFIYTLIDAGFCECDKCESRRSRLRAVGLVE